MVMKTLANKKDLTHHVFLPVHSAPIHTAYRFNQAIISRSVCVFIDVTQLYSWASKT